MGTRGERGFHTSCFGMTVMMGGDSCGDGGDVDEAREGVVHLTLEHNDLESQQLGLRSSATVCFRPQK